MSLAMVAGASSADLYTKAPPPPPPVWSWTGCYVGAGGGYGMFDISSPQIVTAQVPDLDVAVEYAVNGIYSNKGETCSAGSRTSSSSI